MKQRTSILLSTFLALGLLSTAASADIKKGQKAYLKNCKKCHGNGTKGAAMKTQDEWEEAFEDDSAMMKEWHKGDKSENSLMVKNTRNSHRTLKTSSMSTVQTQETFPPAVKKSSFSRSCTII